MADFLDIIPKELALIFLSGYLLFLVKNWDSLFLTRKKDENIEFNFIFRESAFLGIVLYAFFALILSLSQFLHPVNNFQDQITASSSIFSLSLSFSLLVVKAIYPRLAHWSSRANDFFKQKKMPKPILIFFIFLIIILVGYQLWFNSIIGTFISGVLLIGVYIIARETLAGINWERDTSLIIELIFALIIIFSILLVLAFSRVVAT